jgi:hypothetical protein
MLLNCELCKQQLVFDDDSLINAGVNADVMKNDTLLIFLVVGAEEYITVITFIHHSPLQYLQLTAWLIIIYYHS